MYQDKFIRKAKVINVVDGDTLDAIVDLGYSVTTLQRFRLKGIDAPELNGKDQAAAQRSKKYLEGLVLNEEVMIESTKTDSFGRYLADIYIVLLSTQVQINKLMVIKGMAIEYKR